MLIKSFKILPIFLLFLMNRSFAQDPGRHIDAGFRLGLGNANIGTSVTARYFIAPKLAVSGMLSFSGPGGIALLVEKHFGIEDMPLQAFLGAGAYARFGSKAFFGTQAIAGLEYTFPQYPVMIAVDWKPELNLLRSLEFRPGGFGLTLRYRLDL